MNWLLILGLAALGVVMSALTIFGVLPASMWFSVVLILVAAVLLGNRVQHRLFMHGFLTAVIWTLIGGALQFLFWDSFIANNPEIQEKMSKVPEGMDIRPWMVVGIVGGAALYGVVLGALALLANKLLGEKPPVAESVSTQEETPES